MSLRSLKKAERYADQVIALRDQMSGLSDAALKQLTSNFRTKLVSSYAEDDIVVEAFAAIREAVRRCTGKELYRVQLISGFLLLWGNIAEQYTGEGKSLSAILPAYVVGLSRNGCHIVTVNDYLAERDAREIGDCLRWMGVTVGCVLSTMDRSERKAQYDCDVLYITNNELGFDYLKDNTVSNLKDVVQRGFNFCVIDEADSILIDEARTPLIISQESDTPSELYSVADFFVRSLERGETTEVSKIESISGIMATETGDFIVDEKDKKVYLTERGLKKVDEFFGKSVFGDVLQYHHILAALKAHYLMLRDRDYIVKDDSIVIVDEFTGRLMPQRRYSDGLHQAIEAKEKVDVQRESVTMATITFQSLFNKYKRKSGMTGTAITERRELFEVYGLNVVTVPTNKPMIRVDKHDVVYLDECHKWNAVADAIESAHKDLKPVLVGTVSVEASEHLSKILVARGVPHRVLNAKHDAEEADIISQAGRIGAVTIATNMAGRGTDIVPENPSETGGLLVIGTERHSARRIDNQLRGRSGRQGDPGESIFFISLEDDVIRLFGSDRTIRLFKALGFDENEPIVHPRMNRMIRNAQKHVEENDFGVRRMLMRFDEVDNQLRETFYSQRNMILKSKDVSDIIQMMFDQVANMIATACVRKPLIQSRILEDMFNIYVPSGTVPVFEKEVSSYDEILDGVKDSLHYGYISEMSKALSLGYKQSNLECTAVLRQMDAQWSRHLARMEQLRQGIGLLGYGQRNIYLEYKIAGYDMFRQMLMDICVGVMRMLFSVHTLRRLNDAG